MYTVTILLLLPKELIFSSFYRKAPDPEIVWLERWNKIGRRLRYVLSWPQIISFAFLAFIALLITLTHSFTLAVTPWSCSNDHLYFICVMGTIAEMGLFLGYHWLSNGVRSLPYWGLEVTPTLSLRPISSFLFRRQWLNNILVITFMVSLAASAFFDSSSRQVILLPLVGLFALLCLVDLWRIFYYNYILFSLAAFFFPSPQVTILVVLASIYLWSGFGKLVKKEFYESTAPDAFRHVDMVLDWTISTLGLTQVLGDRRKQILFNLVAGIGVMTEMVMGMVFFAVPFGVVPTFVLNATLTFNYFMHCYIVIFIGLANNIHTFISWNMWCTLLAQFILSPAFCGDILLASAWHPFHWFTLLVMTIPPILMLFGKCPNGALSHSYFAPGWYGCVSIFLPIKAADKIPRRVNGQELFRYTQDTYAEDFDYILSCFTRALPTLSTTTTTTSNNNNNNNNSSSDLDIHITTRKMRRPFLLAEDSEEDVYDLTDLEFFKSRAVVLGDTWTDCTFNYGPGDPAQEFYGPAPPAFWRNLVAELMPEYSNGGGFILVRAEFSVLRKGFYRSYVLQL